MDMINRSQTTIAPPASRRGQQRLRVVKCPVCSTPMTADDLRPDPVLLRRVRRAQELQQREDEDDHLEGDGRKRKDRSTGITLGSDAESDDDAMDVDAQQVSQRVKMEPLSQAAGAVESEDGSSSDSESQDAEVEEAENVENTGENAGESDAADEEEQNEAQNRNVDAQKNVQQADVPNEKAQEKEVSEDSTSEDSDSDSEDSDSDIQPKVERGSEDESQDSD